MLTARVTSVKGAFERYVICGITIYRGKARPYLRRDILRILIDIVDFVPNYDNSMTEPVLLPTRFPAVLVNNNVGIAVSMASNICSFNLSEVCETAAALMKNPEHDIVSTLKGPDFPGGLRIQGRERKPQVYMLPDVEA